ncbi:hypothetical protein IWT25_02338 [Secundilactobacillus pentosiphilus]|uniref:Lipoprotein n=1 Tax=Secundilactobacillus pentosiphilus TaxID=1714682 RepID=A0A1Z5IYS5_9LACO|nr:hypothetical protein [Secundilactobacillus pentosiphilus]GAX06990.1 hypothetical protein IWT25_02338 [Secundilactobacillus pentosiphilus]
MQKFLKFVIILLFLTFGLTACGQSSQIQKWNDKSSYKTASSATTNYGSKLKFNKAKVLSVAYNADTNDTKYLIKSNGEYFVGSYKGKKEIDKGNILTGFGISIGPGTITDSMEANGMAEEKYDHISVTMMDLDKLFIVKQ